MRLIDADSIKFTTYINGDITVSKEAIKKMPTAYDVEKVVEELQSESYRWKESGEAYEDDKELGVADGFKRAIEIVKSGGVSKE